MPALPPKVSVIIPCFNHGEFLPEAVASVKATRRDDVEIIVVDDGSTDERTREETDALASQEITLIRKKNGGLASARNAGIALARGEYIFPLDADDHMRPECLDREISVLDANPHVGVVYSDGEFFGARSGRWEIGPFDAEHLLRWNYIACCALYRRLIWEQAGGYDATMPVQGLEDWDLWLSALEHGWEFRYIPLTLFEYRVATESMITRTAGCEAQVANFISRKHGPLYRKAWLQAQSEIKDLKNQLESGTATLRNLRRIAKSRIIKKFKASRAPGTKDAAR
ncbi:MAG TPA: glycosyltransferase [Candidatus Acidoferrum sp.]|jgi:glycosyltransferase involved in cell wall biosynthesis|nr:glycosyltransferase [Candidatus Acidoferrum sp.]